MVVQARPSARYTYQQSHQQAIGSTSTHATSTATRRQTEWKRKSRSERMLRSLLHIVATYGQFDSWFPSQFTKGLGLICCSCFDTAIHCKCAPLMSDLMKRARLESWRLIVGFFFPLVGTVLRDVWVIVQITLSLTSLCLTLATLSESLDQRSVLNGLGLALSVISFTLSLMDAILDFHHRIPKYYRNISGWIGNYLRGAGHLQDRNTSLESTPSNTESIAPVRPAADKPTVYERYSDPIRSFVSELIIYPHLIISFFQFITSRTYSPSSTVEWVSLVLFCIGLVYLILGVYVVRLGVLGSFAVTVAKADIESYGGWIAAYPSCFFSIVLTQMVAQTSLLIGIGVRIYNENTTGMSTSDANVSWQLIVMIIGAFFIPLLGILMFLLTTYYWMDGFSIGLLLKLLELLESKNFPNFVFEAEGINDEKVNELIQKLRNEIKIKDLQKEYGKRYYLFDYCDLKAFANPFRAPGVVAFSILFSLLTCGYMLCAFYGEGAAPVEARFAVVFLLAANPYVFGIATFWTIPTFSIILLAAFISVFFCCGFLGIAVFCVTQNCSDSHGAATVTAWGISFLLLLFVNLFVAVNK